MNMKVTRTGGARGPEGTKKTSKPSSGDGSFADSLKEASAATADVATPEVSGAVGVEGLLAAQGATDPTADQRHRQKLMAYGDDLLERLDDLRLGILLGRFSKEKLADLAQRLRQKREQGNDPKLDDILAEIELRAEVEIAKYTRKA
jgi:hypothetical protein